MPRRSADWPCVVSAGVHRTRCDENEASAAYADQASGVVRAVVGQELRPGNVWESPELPVLRDSPSVTKIVRIDPLTGEEVVMYP